MDTLEWIWVLFGYSNKRYSFIENKITRDTKKGGKEINRVQTLRWFRTPTTSGHLATALRVFSQFALLHSVNFGYPQNVIRHRHKED